MLRLLCSYWALTLRGEEIQFTPLSDDSNILNDIVSWSPKSGMILQWLGGLVIVTSIGLCIGADADREFYSRWPARLNQRYEQWDALIKSGAAPGRGVFLKFVNFPKNAGGFTANVYYRAVYAMYPEPVLVAEPGVLINGTMQLLGGNSIPDEQSLRNRGVGSVVILHLVGMQPVIARVKWLGD
jgi:hypothetical protein